MKSASEMNQWDGWEEDTNGERRNAKTVLSDGDCLIQ